MKTPLTALVGALLVLPVAAYAAEDLCTVKQGEKTISAEQAKEKMALAGYTDIRSVEMEHGCLEGKGMTADGKKLEVYVHPVSGEIVKVKTK